MNITQKAQFAEHLSQLQTGRSNTEQKNYVKQKQEQREERKKRTI